jgi:hypothetical protein
LTGSTVRATGVVPQVHMSCAPFTTLKGMHLPSVSAGAHNVRKDRSVVVTLR